MAFEVREIVDYLNPAKLRATYGAVGSTLGVPARSVSRLLGQRKREVSRIVNASTGMPTGYPTDQRYPDLRLHARIISDAGELRRLILEDAKTRR